MIFIRAPVISSVGPSVEILARAEGAIVACRQGKFLATTFHPELSDDLRVHEYFAEMARRH
jgi:5'-phosphate synthase pdxT subunit